MPYEITKVPYVYPKVLYKIAKVPSIAHDSKAAASPLPAYIP
jgi:hypothetical protein